MYRGIQGRVCRYEVYEPKPGGGRYEWHYRHKAEPGESLSHGNLHPIKGEPPAGLSGCLYLVPEYLLGSDYSGSTVEIANLRAFMAEYGDAPGVHEIYGGHGTRGAAIRLDALTDEMAERLAAMSDYPLLDEEELSRVEMELADEAWESWAEWESRRGLEKAWGVDIDGRIPRDWFERLAERTNTYWEADGPDMHIRVERVIEAATLDDLAALAAEGVEISWQDETAERLWAAHLDGKGGALCALHDHLIDD